MAFATNKSPDRVQDDFLCLLLTVGAGRQNTGQHRAVTSHDQPREGDRTVPADQQTVQAELLLPQEVQGGNEIEISRL